MPDRSFKDLHAMEEAYTADMRSRMLALEEENAVLRRALDERSLGPRARRWVGRAMATLVLVLGVAIVALYVRRGTNSEEIRAAFMEGFRDGSLAAGKALPPPQPVAPPTAPAAPRPPAAP